jgi:potassium/hydrogen antiporter
MEPSAALVSAQQVLLSAAIILAAGSFAGFCATRIGVPDIVLFLLTGVMLGPQVAGVIDIPAASALNQLVLLFGASYILFDGGAALRFSVLKQVWVTVVVIATIGVLVTGAVTALAAAPLLKLAPIIALLLGATLAATDPATLVPVFKQIKVRERVTQTVIAESAFNDAMGAVFALTVLGIARGVEQFSLQGVSIDFGRDSVIGIAFGALAGYVATVLIAHERFGFLRAYLPLVTLICVIGAYASADNLGASGFLCVFVAGLFLGNRESFGMKLGTDEVQRLGDFIDTTALIMRMFIFILLGTQVDFALLARYLWPALGVVAVLVFVARPITVLLCALPDRRARWTRSELLFLCWTRETGVIPAALAGIIAGTGVQGADMITAVTFVAILLTILVQATTKRWLARRLGLLVE